VPVVINSTYLLADLDPSGADMFRKAGYFFNGWTLVCDDASTLVNEININEQDVTVYAYWSVAVPTFITLTLNLNNGGGVIDDDIIIIEVPAYSSELPDEFKNYNPMWPGHILFGWTFERDDVSTLVEQLIIEDVDITLYAFWHTVSDGLLTFDGNGGENAYGHMFYSVVLPLNSTHQLSDLEPKGLDMFKRAGYYFIGWTLEKDNLSKIVTSVDIVYSDITVFAYWSYYQV
jgi:uncharacterized repeat protein (TIGR02543 family)